MVTNRLIEEKSPYLLQHAHNPVDWYPWGADAFNAAKQKDRLLFLSIGYSTCHWCHVMARESFADSAVANALNNAFICVKVDREERPDIDHLYMLACQMLAGNGGWPLSIIITQEKLPVFASTYLPPHSNLNRLGVVDLSKRMSELWMEQRQKVIDAGEHLLHSMQKIIVPERDSFKQNFPKQVYNALVSQYDEEHGGFGTSPKFPAAHNILFLIRYHKATGNGLPMIDLTLKRMRQGGIYDQIGHGFHRYSTDAKWLLPHFEKMLYDQAMLSLAYLEAVKIFPNTTLYQKTVCETLDYVLQNLCHENGAFFCGEDADSEGEEGKFYTWTSEELKTLLNDDAYNYITSHFGIENEGNFYDEANATKTGANIFSFTKPEEDIDYTFFELIRNTLLHHRNKRVHPHLDDKILTDWNGLTIAALARAAKIMDRNDYLKAAEKAAHFLLSPPSLMHRFREGEWAVDAFLDDYACIIFGLVEIYKATQKKEYLQKAAELTQSMINIFWDKDKKLFVFASQTSELPIIYTPIHDGASPSGNSLALYVLLDLASLTSNAEYIKIANELADTMMGEAKSNPAAFSFFALAALEGVVY
jgi:uncharacterized protein YyaL (SSP411 family)